MHGKWQRIPQKAHILRMEQKNMHGAVRTGGIQTAEILTPCIRLILLRQEYSAECI